MPDFYAWERLALQHVRPVRRMFAAASLGSDFAIVRSHAAYNEVCFVEHVMGVSEERSWNDTVRAWATP